MVVTAVDYLLRIFCLLVHQHPQIHLTGYYKQRRNRMLILGRLQDNVRLIEVGKTNLLTHFAQRDNRQS